MHAMLLQAGERVILDCRLRWLDAVLVGAGRDAWQPVAGGPADVTVVVESRTAPWHDQAWERVDRDVYRRGPAVVVVDAGGCGFDLRVEACDHGLRVAARWRPDPGTRTARALSRGRWSRLVRAVLLEYPALWWAGTRRRAPLCAGALRTAGTAPLLVGPDDLVRATVLDGVATTGADPCSAGLVVSDGLRVYGVVEPVPIGGTERALPGRIPELAPDRLILLRPEPATHREPEPGEVADALTARTYLAGALGGYWAFAAALALGTGLGPAHPPVRAVARALAGRLPRAWAASAAFQQTSQYERA